MHIRRSPDAQRPTAAEPGSPRRAAGLALMLACGTWACGPSQESPRAQPWNVVIALVDTLRADHLSLYGYGRRTSPRVDELAARSVVFTNARSQAPCTFPSVNSLLTSRDPAAFRNQLDLMIGIPRSTPSIAELLAGSGYRTLAVSASPVVRRSRSANNFFGGFGRGFDAFDETCENRAAACVNQRALALLDQEGDGDRPFFLYLHYMEPHDPYHPPSGHEPHFAAAWRGAPAIAAGDPNPLVQRLKHGPPGWQVPKAALQHLIDLYDEEIAYFDARFGELLDALRQRGLSDSTLIVLLSDHGEDFFERRSLKHCNGTRDTQIHVPLVIHVPGGPEPRVVDAAVGNIDVVPTLLDFLSPVLEPRHAAARDAMEGSSLRPWMEGAAVPDRVAFSSWDAWRSAVQGRHKLSLHLPSGALRVYDLAADPAEEHDRRAELPDVARRLERAIRTRIARVEPDAADDTEARLRALGYLE